MTRIIFHIGAPKCGSTFIQRVLLNNRAKLSKQGVLYPHSGDDHPGNGDVFKRVSPLWFQGKAAKFHTIIFSHEDFFATAGRHAKKIKDLRTQKFAPVAIAFLRRFDEQIFADLSQTLKQASLQTVPHRIDRVPQNFTQFTRSRYRKYQFHQYLKEWSNIMPNLHVESKDNVQDSLCKLCPDVRDIQWQLPKWRANPSISLTQSERIMECIRSSNVEQARSALNESASMRSGFDPSRTRQRKKWIGSLFHDQIQKIKTDYGLDLSPHP